MPTPILTMNFSRNPRDAVPTWVLRYSHGGFPTSRISASVIL